IPSSVEPLRDGAAACRMRRPGLTDAVRDLYCRTRLGSDSNSWLPRRPHRGYRTSRRLRSAVSGERLLHLSRTDDYELPADRDRFDAVRIGDLGMDFRCLESAGWSWWARRG